MGLLRKLNLMDSLEVDCTTVASHDKATKSHNDEHQKRSERSLRESLTGEARMNAYKDRIAETERVKERRRVRVERGAGYVLLEPGNRDDEQMAVRHVDASGGDVIESQHEENRHPRWQKKIRGSK